MYNSRTGHGAVRTLTTAPGSASRAITTPFVPPPEPLHAPLSAPKQSPLLESPTVFSVRPSYGSESCHHASCPAYRCLYVTHTAHRTVTTSLVSPTELSVRRKGCDHASRPAHRAVSTSLIPPTEPSPRHSYRPRAVRTPLVLLMSLSIRPSYHPHGCPFAPRISHRAVRTPIGPPKEPSPRLLYSALNVSVYTYKVLSHNIPISDLYMETLTDVRRRRAGDVLARAT